MKTEFQFELTKPIKYDAGGEKVEGAFITLAHPSYKQMDKCVPLKQAFYRAAADIDADTEAVAAAVATAAAAAAATGATPEDTDITPEGLISLFYQSDEDMVKIILYGVELFKSPGIALIDGSTSMTHPMIEQLSQDDLENMLGQYMVNFILASALSKAGSK
ncbi:MAG: hypothetical protein V3V40_05875 [Nitrosomonadaceae bacterium]